MHNEELHNLSFSSRIIKPRMRCVACMGMMKNAHKVLFGKPEGKRSLGRRRHGWEDNIKMNLRETGWEDVDCIHLA
jgi:hypothetical protein